MSDDPFEIADRAAEAQKKARQFAQGPLRNTMRIAMGTMRTARVMMTTSIVRGRWHATTGGLWLLVVAALWVAVTTNGSWTSAIIPLWLLSFHSFGYLLGLPFLLAVPGRLGFVLRCLVYPTICLAMFWLIASVRLYQERGRHLLLEELLFRFGTPPLRTIILGLLFSWPALLFILCFAAAIVALHWLHKPFRRTVSIFLALLLIVVSQVSGIILLGTSSLGDVNYFTLRQKPACAPWCWVHRHVHRYGDGPPPHPVFTAAATFRHDLSAPMWALGPEPILSTLVGRYPRRNVVVLLLESHRLAEIAPHGVGAWNHRSLSPNLTALCERGLFLSNYIQSGPGTFYARFSLGTGLPGLSTFTIGGCPEGNELMRTGPLAEFVADNYRCEWLQSADPAYSGWDRYLSSIGVSGWIEGDELTQALKDKDQDDWTIWGMPDSALLEIAWNRYRKHLDDPSPYLLTILTVSNHEPYSLPRSAGPLPKNHDGGMQYADECLAVFMGRLMTLPEAQRPVILITGDHSHRDALTNAKPLGPEGLEGIRIPGLLITPDGFAAGQVCTTPFVHEDALDLMRVMVGKLEKDVPHKFIDAHRLAVPTVGGAGTSIVTENAFYSAAMGSAYERHDSWNLVPASTEIEQQLIQAKAAIDSAMRGMWKR